MFILSISPSPKLSFLLKNQSDSPGLTATLQINSTIYPPVWKKQLFPLPREWGINLKNLILSLLLSTLLLRNSQLQDMVEHFLTLSVSAEKYFFFNWVILQTPKSKNIFRTRILQYLKRVKLKAFLYRPKVKSSWGFTSCQISA